MDSATPSEPDWSAATTRLLVACEAAVDRFAKEYPSERCSFLALAVGECFGEVVLAIDTLANGMARARRHEAVVVRTRTRTLSTEFGWRNAGYHLNRTPIAAHSPTTAEFAFADFARVHFPDWEPYFLEHRRPGEPDPTGKVAGLLQRVANAIVERGRLARLNLASPCYIGGEFARDDLGLVVLRALNWPS